MRLRDSMRSGTGLFRSQSTCPRRSCAWRVARLWGRKPARSQIACWRALWKKGVPARRWMLRGRRGPVTRTAGVREGRGTQGWESCASVQGTEGRSESVSYSSAAGIPQRSLIRRLGKGRPEPPHGAARRVVALVDIVVPGAAIVPNRGG